jgi:hypothetical protein
MNVDRKKVNKKNIHHLMIYLKRVKTFKIKSHLERF